MRRETISATFALIGLVTLFMVSSVVSPEKISLGDMDKHEGDVVIVEGFVEDIRTTSGGNTIIDIVDESGKGKIFLYGKVDVFIGERIEVLGRVQRYRGDFEIIADRVTKIGGEIKEIKLSQLSENPQEFLNQYIILFGYIKSFDNDFVELKDGDYRIKVTYPLRGYGNLEKGDKILLKGKFLYNSKTLSYYILSVEVERIE